MFPVCLFFGNQVEKYCLKINFLPKKKGENVHNVQTISIQKMN